MCKILEMLFSNLLLTVRWAKSPEKVVHMMLKSCSYQFGKLQSDVVTYLPYVILNIVLMVVTCCILYDTECLLATAQRKGHLHALAQVTWC